MFVNKEAQDRLSHVNVRDPRLIDPLWDFWAANGEGRDE